MTKPSPFSPETSHYMHLFHKQFSIYVFFSHSESITMSLEDLSNLVPGTAVQLPRRGP